MTQYPDLLPGDQINPEAPRRWLLVKRELGIPGEPNSSSIWSPDHFFLDQDGIPTFVECKCVADTHIRREVVAHCDLDIGINYENCQRNLTLQIGFWRFLFSPEGTQIGKTVLCPEVDPKFAKIELLIRTYAIDRVGLLPC